MKFQTPYIIKARHKGPGEFFFVRPGVADAAEELENLLRNQTEDTRRWAVDAHMDIFREEVAGVILALSQEPAAVVRQECLSLMARLYMIVENVELREKESVIDGNTDTASIE